MAKHKAVHMGDAYRTAVGKVPGDPAYRFRDDASELAVAEYNSVRTDCLQGLAGQQSILAWSIAAIGLVFAAGLTFNPSHVVYGSTIRAVVFGVAVPLVAFGASVAWLGEIFRMERDAHFLRLLERSTWTPEQRDAPAVTDAWVGRTPLVYNAWVAHSEPLARNRVVGYLGGLVIYSGAVLGGFMLCALLVHHGRVWIVTVEAVVFIAYLLVTILQVRHIMKYSELTAVGAAAQVTGPIRVPPSGRP